MKNNGGLEKKKEKKEAKKEREWAISPKIARQKVQQDQVKELTREDRKSRNSPEISDVTSISGITSLPSRKTKTPIQVTCPQI